MKLIGLFRDGKFEKTDTVDISNVEKAFYCFVNFVYPNLLRGNYIEHSCPPGPNVIEKAHEEVKRALKAMTGVEIPDDIVNKFDPRTSLLLAFTNDKLRLLTFYHISYINICEWKSYKFSSYNSKNVILLYSFIKPMNETKNIFEDDIFMVTFSSPSLIFIDYLWYKENDMEKIVELKSHMVSKTCLSLSKSDLMRLIE